MCFNVLFLLVHELGGDLVEDLFIVLRIFTSLFQRSGISLTIAAELKHTERAFMFAVCKNSF